MKTYIIITFLTVLPFLTTLTTVHAQPYADKDFVKFSSTVSDDMAEKSEAQKARERLVMHKKYASSHKNSLFKRAPKVSFNVFGYSTAVTNNLNTRIEDNAVYLHDEAVGSFYTESDQHVNINTISISDRQTAWRSSETSSEYLWKEFNRNQAFAFGATVELRFVEANKLDIQEGFFLTLGILQIINQVPDIQYHKEFPTLFPIGAGYVIPGNQHFWTEVGASALVGADGFNGAKFDFMVAVGKVKVGPSFTYSSFNSCLSYHFGSMGINIGIIP